MHAAVEFAHSEAEARILILTPERFCIEAQDVPWQLSTLGVWRCWPAGGPTAVMKMWHLVIG